MENLVKAVRRGIGVSPKKLQKSFMLAFPL